MASSQTTEPVEPAPTEPEKPEIAPEAPKRGGRGKLIAIIIVAIIAIAAIAVAVIFYTGTGSLSVTTPATFISAGTAATLTAQITTPPLASAGAVSWNFGDGSTNSTSASVSHTYSYPGTFYVLASTSLSNGKTADNSNNLRTIQVSLPNVETPALGTTSSYAVIVLNKTASGTGAPNIAVGGEIAIAASVQQQPTFSWNNEFNTGNNSWSNYSWAPVSMTVDWGDGSSVMTNSTADPFGTSLDVFPVHHTYSTQGIYALSVSVTTQNYSATQYNGVPKSPAEVKVVGSTASTKVGQTITAGPYSPPKFTVVNPGIVTNMEAVTGGYFTLDPSLDYESTGFEIIANVYETLLAYNGTSTHDFVPEIASGLPTWSSDFLNYTFHVRTNLTFQNGDPVTAWDVKYSITRTMLFDDGSPFPPGWIVSQYLVPNTFVKGTINASLYKTLYNSIQVDNTTSTVTFHLQVPAPPLLFEQVVADPLGTGIMDHKWLEANGPALTWSPAGFTAYVKYGSESNYVLAWRNAAMGSGPFKVLFENNPNSVVLAPNEHFTQLIGVPPADSSVQKVILQYVASDSTRELSLQSGQADIAGIPSSHFNVVEGMVGQGLVNTQFVQTLNLFWWNFNFDVAYQGGRNTYGNTIPSNFFIDSNIRKAFFYAFDFNQYIQTFVGNGIYHQPFGQTYNGIIPSGMLGYQNLTYYNTFNMALAKQYYQQSAWYKAHPTTPITIAINVETADVVDQAAAAAWETNIEALDPGAITASTALLSFADEIANSAAWNDPMSIYLLGWLPDYPFPTDYTIPMLLPNSGPVGDAANASGGTYPNANNLDIPLFAADANGTTQASNLTKMRNLLLDSITTNATNVVAVVADSQQAQMMAANLTLYVPTQQQETFFTYRTWMGGFAKETNPVLGGTDLLYDVLVKATGTVSSASVSTYSLSGVALALLGATGPLAVFGLVGVEATRVGSRRRR